MSVNYRASSLHKTRIRSSVSIDIRGQALHRRAANSASPGDFFHLALISNRHRQLRGSLQFNSDSDWRHDRCAINGADDGDYLRCCDGIFTTRPACFRAYCSRDHCGDSLLLPVVVDRTELYHLIYKQWRDHLAHQPRTLCAPHRVGGGRGWRLYYLPRRNRRRAGRRCNRHLARASVVRCRDLSSVWSNECSHGLLSPLYDQLSRHSFRGRRGPDDCRLRKVGCLDRANTFAPSGHHSFRGMPCAHSHSPLADSLSKHHRHRG